MSNVQCNVNDRLFKVDQTSETTTTTYLFLYLVTTERPYAAKMAVWFSGTSLFIKHQVTFIEILRQKQDLDVDMNKDLPPKTSTSHFSKCPTADNVVLLGRTVSHV